MIDDPKNLYPHQIAAIAAIEAKLEGGNVPEIVFITGHMGGKSVVMEEIQRRVEAGEFEDAKIVAMGYDELYAKQDKEMYDGLVFIDSVTEIVDYKLKVRQQVQDAISKLAAEAVELVASEKPWITMNDWRNNRGRKNKR